ncbi:sodium channel protein Nach-like [Phlebotomus argentipes]|uniref:sodium channel protein Nach-like n=1 Tax=Phlebotomus argentipes TaxID=94469 RepID=UPI002893766D|nr:sodium channel protein Nach-like [Phlebotomus argentipes]
MKLKGFKDFRIAFWKCLIEYFETSNLHGYREFVNGDTFWIRRIVCIWMPIFCTAWGIQLVLHEYNFFVSHPMITTLISNQYPARNFPFPAVAICPNNKISKTKAWKYAQELHNSSNGIQSVEFIFQKLKYFGHLIDALDPNPADAVWLQEFVDNYDDPDPAKWIDTRDVMKRLMPDCENILLQCIYEEEIVNCKKIFTRRRLIEGYCCSFNYLRETDDFKTTQKMIYPKLTGIGKGLTVVINASTDDYHFPLLSNDGFNIHIFYPHDYPDPSAGLIIKRFVAPLMESFIQLRVIIVKALQKVRFFSENQRGCRFPEDLAKEYNMYYSYSDCLVRCKIHSAATLCGCVPFFLPRNFQDLAVVTTPMCSLNHLPCLEKYRIKVKIYRPRVPVPGLEREMEDSLDCRDCLPLCSYVRYGVDQTNSYISMDPNERPSNGIFEKYINQTNVSIVNVYFANSDSVLYHQTVRNSWYGLLSNLGGTLGLCVGFSLVSILEFLYHITFRVYRELYPKEAVLKTHERMTYGEIERILNRQLRQSEQEVKYRVAQPLNDGHNNAWLVVAVIFILLFLLMTGLCIYLCYMRRKRVQEIYDAQHQYAAKIRQQEYLQRTGYI